MLADRLSRGECGGSYAEAVIISCSAISAMAAELWPGKGIDRARFVELIVKFAPSELRVDRLCIPLLVGYLESQGQHLEIKPLQDMLYQYSQSRILTDDEIDLPEPEVKNLCPTLPVEKLRSYSYPNVLYEEVRSGYAHEYCPSARAEASPMTCKADVSVSYINRADATHRLVHFHSGWLFELARGIARRLDELGDVLEVPKPAVWWINGGSV